MEFSHHHLVTGFFVSPFGASRISLHQADCQGTYPRTIPYSSRPFDQATWGKTSTHDCSELLVKKICGLSSLKGEDVLLQHHPDLPASEISPLTHESFCQVMALADRQRMDLEKSGEHIKVLELRATFTAIKWRVERLHQLDVRFLHLVDSLVVLHSLTRGRSLRRTLMRVNSYLLACGLFPRWGYVSTHQNPADRPSRRGVRKNG